MIKVYEFTGDDRIYYTCDPKEIGVLERTWLDNLKKEIKNSSTFKHNVIVNLTWFKAGWEQTEPLRNLIQNLGDKSNVKIWYTGSIDGNDWIKLDYIEIYHYFKKEGYTDSFVGYADEHWHTWYPYWFVKNNTNLDIKKILLDTTPKFLYLSYNRKPKLHRELLVDSLIKENLLEKGWVTYEKNKFPEVDRLSGDTDQEKHSSDLRFSRPEDLTSLGNLSIWRNSYLVIVSETETSDAWQISEKTWKPIFGLRPYVLNSHPNISKILDKLGFFTPADLFKNYKLRGSHTSIIDQIKKLKNLSPTDLHKLWESQYEMLNYNRQRFLELANSDTTKILNWPQAKQKPYSVPVAS